MVEDSSNIGDYFNKLSEVMSDLKALREDGVSGKARRMDRWLQSLESKEREVDELRQNLKELEAARFPKPKVKSALNQKVKGCLKAAQELKERANEISDSFQIFLLSEVATGKALRFSHAELQSYIVKPRVNLGSGEFGDVCKGKLPNNVQVAVKILKGSVTDDMEKQFMAEMGTVSKTYHRNLVKLYGFCFDTKMKALVYEYMDSGSLEKFIGKNPDVEWDKLYDIAKGTARGLSYLHEHCKEHIIHRDIKPSNVLLDTNHIPKIADFGFAKLYSIDKSKVTASSRLMRNYDAPEVRIGDKLTCQCDVYSFGIMLFDILQRKSCQEHDSFPRQLWDKFENKELTVFLQDCGIRENKDIKSAKMLSIIALWCIQFSPQDRPSMSTVLKVLEGEMRIQLPPYPFPPVSSSETTSGSGSTITGGLISSEANSRVLPAIDERLHGISLRERKEANSYSSSSSALRPKSKTKMNKKSTTRTMEKNRTRSKGSDSDSEWYTDSD